MWFGRNRPPGNMFANPRKRPIALSDAAEWLGPRHPLAEQLESAHGIVTLDSASALLETHPVQDRRSLRRFLFAYHERILVPVEFPTIQTAQCYGLCNGVRELVELDRRLAEEPLLRIFAEPSRRIGRGQLQKLRPLRDQRVLQRYLQAVERGEALGWHTVVYGLTLALYSMPLRQGLLGYARQTTRGFIYSAARSLRLSEHDCRELFDEICGKVPAAIEDLLRQPAAA
jgi:urease accessory protein UreF